MALRWTAARMLEPEQQFRRVIGADDLASLAIAVEAGITRSGIADSSPRRYSMQSEPGRNTRAGLIQHRAGARRVPRSTGILSACSKGQMVALYSQPLHAGRMPYRGRTSLTSPAKLNVLAETVEASRPASMPRPLDKQQVAAFEDRGYLVLRSFLPRTEVEGLIREVDHWTGSGLRDASIACAVVASSRRPPAVMELDLARHGWLISHPPLMGVLEQLLGPVFAFHHMHSSRHDPGLAGKEWHHDFEQDPQLDRERTMVHAFHYLSGLNGTVGDLVLLPGSHRIVAGKDGLSHAGTEPLYGEVVIDDVPAGSTVIVHSALFHARRARPGGDGGSRYFIDAAYCQGGAVWPAVKPYWTEMLGRARARGLDRGHWPELFSARHFYEPDGHWPLLADASSAQAARS